jgi:hypothetical protein
VKRLALTLVAIAAVILGIPACGGGSYYQQNVGSPLFGKGYKWGESIRSQTGVAADPTSASLQQYCQQAALDNMTVRWSKDIFNGFWYGCDGQENAWTGS